MEKIWKPVYSYDGYYEISNFGDIRSVDRTVNSKTNRLCRGKELKQVKDHDGYCCVQLSKSGKRKVFFIHRLVMLSFIGFNGDKIQVNHKNGIKSDNNINNLEWVTPSENTRHAWKTGLAKKRQGGF